VQRVTIEVIAITSERSWSNSALVFEDYKDGNVIKRVKIKIDTPATLEYVQERLNEIKDYWKKQL